MSDPQPQSTATLVKRLRRVAKWLSNNADDHCIGHRFAKRKAQSATCRASAERLEALEMALITVQPPQNQPEQNGRK